MGLWRQLVRGLRVLRDRDAADRDVSDEVEHFMAEAVAGLVAEGRSPEEARRLARARYGDALDVREQVRSYGWENLVETTWSDVRHGLRRLGRNPGFTVTSVLTLALGIGASTAVFSAVKPVLFEPLPYPAGERIVSIGYAGGDGAVHASTFGNFRELEVRSRSFETLSVVRPWQPTLTGDIEPERLEGQHVSAGFFRVLGVSPRMGSDFDAAADRPGAPPVVMLSDALFQRRFRGDPTVVGGTIRLDGSPYTVAGVMPPDFENVLAPSAEVWSLLRYDASLPSFEGREWGHHLTMVGRLRPGVETGAAARELARIAGTPVPDFPRPAWSSMEHGLTLDPLQDAIAAAVKPTLLAVIGAVLLLLVIAGVNVTSMLLAWGARRRNELALRTALGAGRDRLVRQLLVESLLLATLGTLLGLAVARIGVEVLVALAPPELPRIDAVALDRGALAFAVALMLTVGVGTGLAPALQASRANLRDGLLHGTRTVTGSYATRRTLVAVEVALAVVLLVGAGLLLRSLTRLFDADLGFDPAGVLVMQVQTAGPRFADDSERHGYFARVVEQVAAVPGVRTVSVTSQLPLSGDNDQYGVHPEHPDPLELDRSAFRYSVSPGYFDALGIRLVAGRLLEATDGAGAPHAVVIDRSLARRRFGAEREALGQRLHIGRTDLPPYTVVGVVDDVKQLSLAAAEADAVYTTPEQMYFASAAMWVVVRPEAASPPPLGAVTAAIRSVDGDQPIVRITTMERLVSVSEARRRFALLVFEAFGLLALLLAAVGIHGVLSASVNDRIREIGVRSALGATRLRILWVVLRQGMGVAAVGGAIGVAAALVGSRAVVALLYGISRVDAITYACVLALIGFVSLLACGIPALRAAAVDPTVALRAE